MLSCFWGTAGANGGLLWFLEEGKNGWLGGRKKWCIG